MILYLEDECEGVFLILEEDLEPVLGIEFLAGLEPGKGGLLSGLDSLLTTLEQSEHVLGVCGGDILSKNDAGMTHDGTHS